MSGVQVLVGARKGSFRLTVGRRRSWRSVSLTSGLGDLPPQGVAGRSQSDYASQSEWLVQTTMQRTPTTAAAPGPGRYEATSATKAVPAAPYQWYDGTQHPWEFQKRVWHLRPSRWRQSITVYAGVEDAGVRIPTPA